MFKPSSTPRIAPANDASTAAPWHVLIVDDEPMAHTITEMALRDMVFEGHRVVFHSAYSGQHARALLAELPQIAVAFIDVVMESDDAGLDLVSFIRNERDDHLMRIVLRTGQSGTLPERHSLHDHDINTYLDKAGVDASRLYAALLTGLRSFGEVKQLREAMQRLEALVSTDSLTGLGSQRHLRAALQRALSAARRRAEPLSLVFLDLDNFKHINDEQGHLRGDEVLRAVGQAILSHSRTEDGCFRYGGDEFVVILPSCTADQARAHYCRRLLDEFERIDVCASVGVAQTGPEHYDELELLIQIADADMYAAKRVRKGALGDAAQRRLLPLASAASA